jgi:pyroglutamyl-peptidase
MAKATFPAALVVAALNHAGVKAATSMNAGDYLCNQTLYLSLAAGRASAIGFIHMPRLARRRFGPRPKDAAPKQRPTLDQAACAAVAAIRVMAAHPLRGRLSKLAMNPSANRSTGERRLDPTPVLA